MSKSYEQLRQEVKKKYDGQITELQSKVKTLSDRNISLVKENEKLLEENSNLSSELGQYKDWVERLIEYANMSEEDLQNLKLSLKADACKTEAWSHLTHLMDAMGGLAFFGGVGKR